MKSACCARHSWLLAGASVLVLATLARAQVPETEGAQASGRVPVAHADARGDSARAPAPLPADLVAASTAQLRREVARGDAVSVVQSTGEVFTGRVLRVSDTSLELRADPVPSGGRPRRLDLTIPLSSIAALDRPRDPLNNGILIGAGIGAGVGVALLSYAYAVDANESDEWLAGSLVTTAAFAGIGAMVGLAIDAAHSKPHFRYRREAATTTVRIAPMLTRGPGVAVAVTF